VISKNLGGEEALNCQRSQPPDGIISHPMPSRQPARRWTWYAQIALCCCCLRVGSVWPTLYEIFVPDVSRGWLSAFGGALPIGNTKQQVWEDTWAEWIWTKVPNMLWDAVLICTIYYANSPTAGMCYIACVVLAPFLQVLKLVEDQPVTCFAKHIKARSTLQPLCCITLDLNKLLPYLFAAVG